MKRLACFLPFTLALALGATNTEAASAPEKPALTSKQWLANTKHVVTSPARWDSGEWQQALFLGGVTYLVHDNDEAIRRHVQTSRSGGTDNAAKLGNAVPAAGALYFTGTYFYGNDRQRKTAVNALESAATALVITEGLKFIAHRDRPNGQDDDSFPSNHTAAAFAMATVAAEEYKENKFAAPLAYGLATLTAYGRLNDDKHWASDVLAGALIGHYTAKQIMKQHDKTPYHVQPYLSATSNGVLVSKQF